VMWNSDNRSCHLGVLPVSAGFSFQTFTILENRRTE
jgi:hypothetical protein